MTSSTWSVRTFNRSATSENQVCSQETAASKCAFVVQHARRPDGRHADREPFAQREAAGFDGPSPRVVITDKVNRPRRRSVKRP